jgi:uncharacterized DUF497 family protein
MKKKLTWDESKRQTNLNKHGLDFADAGEVLASRYRLDVSVVRNGEQRLQSLFVCDASAGRFVTGAFGSKQHGAGRQFSACEPTGIGDVL